MHFQDSVSYILNSGMLGCHRLGAITEVWRLAAKLLDGCVCTVCWPAVFLKLKLVLSL